MANLEQVRDAIAKVLSEFGEIGQGTWIYEDVEELASMPAIIIDVNPGESADFLEVFGGSEEIWKLQIYVLVSRSRGSHEGQQELSPYLAREGPKSIRQAIFEKDHLDLEDTTATVVSLSGYGGRFEIGAIDHVGAILNVQVRTDGRED